MSWWKLLGGAAAILACGAEPPSLPPATSTVGQTTTATTATSAETTTPGSDESTTTGDRDETTSTSSSPPGGSSSTGSPTTACSTCAEDGCATELAECESDEACACWLSCVAGGDMEAACNVQCGVPPEPLTWCAAVTCHDDCYPGQSRIYEPCGPGFAECPPGLYCANAPRHCTFECNGDSSLCPPQPPGSTTPPVCDDIAGGCILDCSGDNAVCPPGLSCAIFNVELCAE